MVDRTRPSAIEALDAISLHLDPDLDMRSFFRSLSQRAATLVHARRAAFWRLDQNSVMAIQPDPFGFDSRVLELRVPLRPDGKSIPEQVVFRDSVDRGLLNREDLVQYQEAIEFLGVRDAAAVSWRVGQLVLGGLAAYDSEAGFTEEDNWTLRIIARGAALVWQYRLAETELRRTMAALEHTADSRRRVLRRLIEANEEARRALARDLHDEPLQALTAASLALRRLRKRSSTSPDAKLAVLIDEVREQVGTADELLRHLLFDLRPASLDLPAGLKAALRDYADRLEREEGIDVTVEPSVPDDLSPSTRYLVFRIVQGALTNVVKHAHAQSVTIGLRLESAGVRGLVKDDGVGFDSNAIGTEPGHLGLVSMRELAEMAGGWWRVDSKRGNGTRVEFWVPSELTGEPSVK